MVSPVSLKYRPPSVSTPSTSKKATRTPWARSSSSGSICRAGEERSAGTAPSSDHLRPHQGRQCAPRPPARPLSTTSTLVMAWASIISAASTPARRGNAARVGVHDLGGGGGRRSAPSMRRRRSPSVKMPSTPCSSTMAERQALGAHLGAWVAERGGATAAPRCRQRITSLTWVSSLRGTAGCERKVFEAAVGRPEGHAASASPMAIWSRGARGGSVVRASFALHAAVSTPDVGHRPRAGDDVDSSAVAQRRGAAGARVHAWAAGRAQDSP